MTFHGFGQTNLYVPVLRSKTIGMCTAKSSAHNLIVESADTSNAYLDRDIDRDVYIEQSYVSNVMLESLDHISKLRKLLYGFRRAGEIWGNIIYSKFIECGFQ